MAFIKTIGDDEAEGVLARLYKEAHARVGKVFQVLRVQGLLPKTLRVSTKLYQQVMHSEGALSRVQCEMLAVAVSRTNACAY